MPINYNKINFVGAVIGSLIGLISALGVPLMLKFSPQNIIYFIMGMMGLLIIMLLVMMIVMLLAKEVIQKLTAPIFLMAIAMAAFFALVTYQRMAPNNAPYIGLVRRINPWHYFQYIPFIMPVIMLVCAGPIIIWLLRFSFTTFFTREYILKNGIGCQAKIIDIKHYGLKVNNKPVFKITLEIYSPSQGAYRVTKSFLIPHMDLGLLEPGKIVNVKISPRNPKNVVFDTWTGEIQS
ncbi:MAG: hypothetical protein NC914_02615 [Candidatus Omnitrophica bacterium]|nr:hypothetical protein [Candidatus Omnitrophota bacterium]